MSVQVGLPPQPRYYPGLSWPFKNDVDKGAHSLLALPRGGREGIQPSQAVRDLKGQTGTGGAGGGESKFHRQQKRLRGGETGKVN